jgi:hypothetical protein
MAIPIKYGLNGSIHEKVAAIPLVPATNAKTGVIQHKDAVIAEKSPAPKIPFSFFIWFLKFYCPQSI